MSESPDGFRLVGVRHVGRSSFLDVQRLHMISPRGVIMERSVVRHPGAVAIVPVDGDDVILIKQYRAPTNSWLLEIPAGKLDVPGEALEEAAKRELEEEVGFRAGTIEPLSSFWTTPGFSDERMWVYLATNLTPVGARPHGAEEEVSEIVRTPIDSVRRLLAADEIEDAKTIIGLVAMLARLG